MNTDLRKKMLNALSKEELIDYIIELESKMECNNHHIYIPNHGEGPYTIPCTTGTPCTTGIPWTATDIQINTTSSNNKDDKVIGTERIYYSSDTYDKIKNY